MRLPKKIRCVNCANSKLSWSWVQWYFRRHRTLPEVRSKETTVGRWKPQTLLDLPWRRDSISFVLASNTWDCYISACFFFFSSSVKVCDSKQCLFLKMFSFLKRLVYSSIVVLIDMYYTKSLSAGSMSFCPYKNIMLSHECCNLSYGLCLFESCSFSFCYYCDDSYWCLHP